MNILIAEDDDTIRELTKVLLKSEGHTVETARHGKDAIAELQGRRDGYFQTIIMDWHMPDMDGHALLTWLKTSPYWRMTVIITTASPERILVPHAILRKPYNYDLLFDLLRTQQGAVPA